MPKFRKKPVEIEARQFDGENYDDIMAWIRRYEHPVVRGSDMASLEIKTLEGWHRADIGDWIIKGVADEFYPCKPDTFDQTYEPVHGEGDDG